MHCLAISCYYISLVPRPSAASFLVAYMTFEPPSDKLADGGSQVTYATKNEAADSLHGNEANVLLHHHWQNHFPWPPLNRKCILGYNFILCNNTFICQSQDKGWICVFENNWTYCPILLYSVITSTHYVAYLHQAIGS